MKKVGQNKRPLFAIITRTKNRNLLLKRALDSVAAQTYKDFVHVVLNDGGDKEEVEKLVSKYDHNIKLIHHPKSVGLTKALNQAIRSVNTEYITILDDDDSWSNDRLELTAKYIESSNAKGIVCVMDRIVEQIQEQTITEISKARLYEGLESISLYKQCLDNYLSNGSFAYLRSVYEELGGYDEKLAVAEDWDFGIRFLLKYDVDFLETEHALINYHHRPEATGDIGNSVFDRVKTHRKHINILANHYLRKDIKDGSFGIGYIMNSLIHRRDTVIPYEEKRLLDQTVRLENHINYASKQAQEELRGRLAKDIKNQLRRLNPLAKLSDRKTKHISNK